MCYFFWQKRASMKKLNGISFGESITLSEHFCKCYYHFESSFLCASVYPKVWKILWTQMLFQNRAFSKGSLKFRLNFILTRCGFMSWIQLSQVRKYECVLQNPLFRKRLFKWGGKLPLRHLYISIHDYMISFINN